MMTICALALNPNLTVEQFKQLAEEHTQAKERCYQIVGDSLKGMDLETAVKYLTNVLPMLIAW